MTTEKVSMDVRVVKAVLFGLFGWMLTTSAIAGGIIGLVAFVVAGQRGGDSDYTFSDESVSWGTGHELGDPWRQ